MNRYAPCVALAAGAIALSGCSNTSPKPQPTSGSFLPAEFYALAENQGAIGDFRHSGATEIRAYLDDQAHQTMNTDADQLYATMWHKKASIPVFTSVANAKQFAQFVYWNHRQKEKASVIAFAMVCLNDSALYARTSNRPEIAAIVINPTFPDERMVTPADVIAGPAAVAAPEITTRKLVWVSDKGSNVDRAE